MAHAPGEISDHPDFLRTGTRGLFNKALLVWAHFSVIITLLNDSAHLLNKLANQVHLYFFVKQSVSPIYMQFIFFLLPNRLHLNKLINEHYTNSFFLTKAPKILNMFWSNHEQFNGPKFISVSG